PRVGGVAQAPAVQPPPTLAMGGGTPVARVASAPMLDWILLGPRLALRTLDDFHGVAQAVALVGKIEPDELHRALDDLHALAVTADRLTDVERALTAVETRLDSRLSDLLSLADKLQQDLRT